MVNYQQYITIALRQCGGGRENMEALGSLWSREKEQLQNMTEDQLREALRCPE
jgi:hypothetical protein